MTATRSYNVTRGAAGGAANCGTRWKRGTTQLFGSYSSFYREQSPRTDATCCTVLFATFHMATATLSVPDNQSVEFGIATLLEKVSAMRRDDTGPPRLLPAKAEMRTLEFWRSIISECLASFFYVFVVCGASVAVAPSGSPGLLVIANALASGFAIAALTQSFGHVSDRLTCDGNRIFRTFAIYHHICHLPTFNDKKKSVTPRFEICNLITSSSDLRKRSHYRSRNISTMIFIVLKYRFIGIFERSFRAQMDTPRNKLQYSQGTSCEPTVPIQTKPMWSVHSHSHALMKTSDTVVRSILSVTNQPSPRRQCHFEPLPHI
ncbi:hypothetical protein J6590_004910 [Homalodisca vitripennis]|nr:hypothetical protein J6590_004910 [Homalodisca vitripennis]